MLWSYVHIQITGADVSGVMRNICEQGIVLENVRAEDGLCVRAVIRYRDLMRVKHMVKKANHRITVIHIGGLFILLSNLVKRPVLVLSVALLVFLSFWIPSRVFFVGVEGNRNVLTTRILQEAESCGICFGSKRSYVRSEIVKNNLLEAIPELQWVGVNTKGCTAMISVREDASQKNSSEAIGYSNIVADRDGIVLYTSVTAGMPACAVGDAVKEGQVLVSGWQDLGLLVKTTRASGEIFAQTERKIEMVTPLTLTQKGQIQQDRMEYSLIVGKKRINLSKGSGISYVGCDKIYASYYLTLPGGFVLPLALETNSKVIHDVSDDYKDAELAQALLAEQADNYLLAQTVSGTIQNRQLHFCKEQTLGRVVAHYTCVEMIGRERVGEMNIHYGENDGENR